MKKWLLGLLLVLVASPVIAGSAILSWTPPNFNEDSTPYINPQGYKLYYGLTQGGPYPTEIDIPDFTIITYEVLDLSPMTYYFVATAYNTLGVESQYSGEAQKIILGIPNPPVGLIVDPSNLFAYSISQTTNKIVLIPVGTVLESTPCDGAMSVNGHYLVPINTVQWAGTSRPPVVFALCL